MEELIEYLQNHSQQTISPLDEATDDSLLEVEEAILLPIPKDYREFQLEVGHVIYGRIEPATVADPRSHTYLPELTAVAWQEGLPREYFVVCAYDGGYAAMGADAKIVFWQADDFRDEWESIWHWVRDVWLDGGI